MRKCRSAVCRGESSLWEPANQRRARCCLHIHHQQRSSASQVIMISLLSTCLPAVGRAASYPSRLVLLLDSCGCASPASAALARHGAAAMAVQPASYWSTWHWPAGMMGPALYTTLNSTRLPSLVGCVASLSRACARVHDCLCRSA